VTDEFFTPPHPIVRARTRGLKKNKIARLKGTAPLRGFESALPSLVGSEITVFLTILLTPLIPKD
jgi:hypothetical protein